MESHLTGCLLNGIPRGTILGPILLLIYIHVNDLPEICKDVYLYADDAKLYKYIGSISDHQILLEKFNELQELSNKWQFFKLLWLLLHSGALMPWICVVHNV